MAIQDKFNKANVIYKITKDIDLDGGTLTIPAGCTLDFQGGSFVNGTIIGNNTKINAGLSNVFKPAITLAGTWNVKEICVDWFISNKSSNCSPAIQNSITLLANNGGGTLLFTVGTYMLSDKIVIKDTPAITIKSNTNTRNTKLEWAGTTGETMFEIYSEIYIAFENIEFRGIHNGIRNSGIGVLFRCYTSNTVSYKIAFRSCFFDGFSKVAVQLGDHALTSLDSQVDYTLFETCYFDRCYKAIEVDSIQCVDTQIIKCEFRGSQDSGLDTLTHIHLRRAGQVIVNGSFFTYARVDITCDSGWVSLNDVSSETGLHTYGQFFVSSSYDEGTEAAGRATKLHLFKNILTHAKGDITEHRSIVINNGPGAEFIDCQVMANVYLANKCRKIINNGLHFLDYSNSEYEGFIPNPSLQIQTLGSSYDSQQVAEIYEPSHVSQATTNIDSGATLININMITNGKYSFFDTNYTVFISPSWNTKYWVSNKKTNGFTVNFETAPTDANQTIDWVAIRSYSSRPLNFL